jgi:hypothetical protein
MVSTPINAVMVAGAKKKQLKARVMQLQEQIVKDFKKVRDEQIYMYMLCFHVHGLRAVVSKKILDVVMSVYTSLVFMYTSTDVCVSVQCAFLHCSSRLRVTGGVVLC